MGAKTAHSSTWATPPVTQTQRYPSRGARTNVLHWPYRTNVLYGRGQPQSASACLEEGRSVDIDGRRAYSCLTRGGLNALSLRELRLLRVQIRTRERLLDAVRLWPCKDDVVEFRGLARRRWRLVLGVTVTCPNASARKILDGDFVRVTYLASDSPGWDGLDARSVLLKTWRATWRDKDPHPVERGLLRAETLSTWLPTELLDARPDVAYVAGSGAGTSGRRWASINARAQADAVASG